MYIHTVANRTHAQQCPHCGESLSAAPELEAEHSVDNAYLFLPPYILGAVLLALQGPVAAAIAVAASLGVFLLYVHLWYTHARRDARMREIAAAPDGQEALSTGSSR